ncbi:MAG: tryptophan synthase subunit alpha [Deltaproteobacteria bacterium]|nr:tryptophan synthase subunit alpha [Deltaproteobacteria bacterium]
MISLISQAFAQAKAEGSAAFIPFMTAGFPDPETFIEILTALDDSGADLIEVGLPFSDPLADGPTIQAASRRALELGVTPERVFDLIAQAKARIKSPLVLMTYFNPILRRGLADFAARTKESGASGVIVPDLPPEEAGDWLVAAEEAGLETIFMVAPTTTPERLERILAVSRGFVYFVSLTGVTGADFFVSPQLVADLRRLRAQSLVPVAVGFGVSTPGQAQALAPAADGVIVGSALIRAVQDSDHGPAQTTAVAELAVALKRALSDSKPDHPADRSRQAASAAKEGP